MTVQTTSDPGQAPAAGTPGQGQDPAGQQDQHPAGTPQAGQAPGDGDPQFSLESIQDPALKAYLQRQESELTRARQEAARYRTEARTHAEQVQQFQRQSETAEQAAQREATERQARLDALEQENRDLKVGGAVQAAAVKAQALNPTTVWDLIKARGLQVETDEQGRPTNVDAVLAAVKASDPYLFRQAQVGADAGAGNGSGQVTGPAGSGDDINSLLRGRGIRAR